MTIFIFIDLLILGLLCIIGGLVIGIAYDKQVKYAPAWLVVLIVLGINIWILAGLYNFHHNLPGDWGGQ